MVFFLCTDKKFFQGLLCTIGSIIFIHKDKPIKFYVYSEDLEKRHLKTIINLVESNNGHTEITILDSSIDLSLALKFREGQGEFIQWGDSLAAYVRLWVASLIDEDKVFYIDTDFLIGKNLSEIWDMDISNYTLLACESSGIKRIGQDIKPESKALDDTSILDKKYFNSGFMLINLRRWRFNKIEQKVLDVISDPMNLVSTYSDQSILNFLLHDEVYFITNDYNCFQSQIDINTENINIHYTGMAKPWLFFRENRAHKKWRKMYRSNVTLIPKYAFSLQYIVSFIDYWLVIIKNKIPFLSRGVIKSNKIT